MSENKSNSSFSLNLTVDQVRQFLPHRAPFLFVDRILEVKYPGPQPAETIEKGFWAPVDTQVVGIKNVTFNEPHFQGHFPQYSIMPGVLILETMAQVASFSIYPSIQHRIDEFTKYFQCILVGVDQVRFRKPVVPGDTLRIETRATKQRGRLWGFHCEALVEGQKVAEADILANMQLSSE